MRLGRWVGMTGWGVLLLAAHPVLAQPQQTLQGEVIDPAVYVKDGQHGPNVEDQTYESVDGGQTLALLEDGTNSVYLFLSTQPGDDPNELVYEYVNRKVAVTGAVYERGGLRGIVPASVTPLEPQGASGPTPPAPANAPGGVNED